MVLEFSGNGFTFEIRKRDAYHTELNSIERKKIVLPNSSDIRETGHISEDSITKLRAELAQIRIIVKELIEAGHNIDAKGIGTAALRDAENSNEIIEAIQSIIGTQIEFETIDGHIEAALCAYGVTEFYPKTTGIVVDMGGGSTEFALLREGKLTDTTSLSMGTASVGEAKKGAKGHIDEALEDLPDSFKEMDTLLLSGGTFRNINKAYCIENGLDIRKAEPNTITLKEYQEYIEDLLKRDDDTWKKLPKSLQLRRDFLDAALKVVKRLKKTFPDDTTVALTKTKTRDGLFRVIAEMLNNPERHPGMKINNWLAETFWHDDIWPKIRATPSLPWQCYSSSNMPELTYPT